MSKTKGNSAITSNGKRAKPAKQHLNDHNGVKEVEFPQVEGKVIESAKFLGHGVDTTFILDFTDGTLSSSIVTRKCTP